MDGMIKPGGKRVKWLVIAGMGLQAVLITVSMLAQAPSSHRIMFYNVENFFDPFDDTLTEDDEFTPGGERQWTYTRFIDKAVKIAKVIIACGEQEPPAIVGLAEVENHFVLEKLVYETPLRPWHYGIIHRDSPDARGIDVALIYRKSQVVVDTFYYLSVNQGIGGRRTRDILMARCIVFSDDTLWVAVNHWPSRYGGAATSEDFREKAAKTLGDHLDTLFQRDANLNLVVMGDFNDEPADHSLQCLAPDKYAIRRPLVNLMHDTGLGGTVKYGGYWYAFDQVLVSSALLESRNGLGIENKKAAVCRAAFLLEADNSHLGGKPFRTFVGPAFHGGFSDHLPVFLTIYKP